MTVAPLLTRALRYGGILAVAVAIVAGVVGWLVAGVPGLLGGILGAALSAVYLGLTAASFLVAGRVTRRDPGGVAFYGIVLGTWVVKLVVFVAFAIWLRGQPWLDPVVFFVTVIVAVAGSLAVDMLVVRSSRIPYVSDVELPESSETETRND